MSNRSTAPPPVPPRPPRANPEIQIDKKAPKKPDSSTKPRQDSLYTSLVPDNFDEIGTEAVNSTQNDSPSLPKPAKPAKMANSSAKSGIFAMDDFVSASDKGKGKGYEPCKISENEVSKTKLEDRNQLSTTKPIPPAPSKARHNMYEAIRRKKEFLASGDSNNNMYHLNSLSTFWIVLTVCVHIVMWVLLLTVGAIVLPVWGLTVLIASGIGIPILLAYSRFVSRKKHIISTFRMSANSTPEQETDSVPDAGIYCLFAAALVEGGMLALYTALIAGVEEQKYNAVGYFTKATLLQTLRFASIAFLALHRCLRPANRIDPMRTVMELEIVSVCWDALDGSTLFQLLDGDTIGSLSLSMNIAIKLLMVTWYISVGVRTGVMYLTHLPPSAKLYQYILPPPLALSLEPTVDRTLEAMRLRSVIIAFMTGAEIYAGTIRLILWSQSKLDSLQQDMAIKNLLFITTIYGAYSMYMSVKDRYWNDRDLGIFGWEIPSREFQLEIFRYAFVIFYLLEGILLTIILLHVSDVGDGTNSNMMTWLTNFAFDVILCVIFLLYCKNVHKQSGSTVPKLWILPQDSFVLFPGWLGTTISSLLAANMFVARLPALYIYANQMASPATGLLWSYSNAMLVVIFSVVPIACLAMFWSVSYLLFRKEFTACPGNYNAIHDPIISMVSTATMIEGSMDILSCAMFMQLAQIDLPPAMNGAVIFFCLLECLNCCTAFGLQSLLSGGHNDTPLDLVRWKAYLRGSRCFIDFGCFVLRLFLWIQYEAVSSSVFLIKNLYNLLHSGSQVERYLGVKSYSQQTLFTQPVSPPDWYNLTKEEWRAATRGTILAQVQAGRSV